MVTSREGAERTIVDCENAGRGFHVHEWEGRATCIERLTIVNGNAQEEYGGGICCDVASPAIVECRIYNCRARSGGGLGLLLFGGVVDRCVISGNWTYDSGGGIMTMFGAGVTITNSVITGNITTGRIGGGVSSQNEFPDILIGCTVAANTAGHVGGGVYTSKRATIDRCVVWGNCAPDYGREIYGTQGGANVTCTAVDSTGVYAYWGGIDFDENCVFTDPLFCGLVDCAQTVEGDWWLAADSPCLAEHSPCGQQIGALGQGCGSSGPSGACCFADGTCAVLDRQQCEEQHGTYLGDDSLCLPDPCHPTPVEETTWGRIKMKYGEGQ